MAALEKLYNRMEKPRQIIRRIAFRAQGGSCNVNCIIGPGVIVKPGIFEGKRGLVSIGANTELSGYVVLDAFGGFIDIDESVFIGPQVVVYGHGGVKIGKNTMIAMQTSIVAAEHEVPGVGMLIRSQPDIRQPVSIGSDVWIGSGCRILAGVNIGDGCVVGSGAVVTKSLPANSIAFGVPAKVVKYRQ